MKRSGMSAVGVIAVVAVIAAVVFGFMYFGSDVFRTKANVAYKDFAEWTPDNIAKDPVNYLNFCEQQTQGAILKLKGSEIAIAQKRTQIEGMLEDNKAKVDTGTKALAELKDAYKKAEPANSFPVTWAGTSLDKEQSKRQILKLAGEIKSKSNLIGKLGAAVDQLKVQSGKVQEARDKAQDQLTQIATSREMLKVQQITDELKNSLVAMKGVLQTSVLGVAASEPGTISLDDLAAKSATSVNEEEFAKIMQQ